MGWKITSIQTEKVKDQNIGTYIDSAIELLDKGLYSEALHRIEEAENLLVAGDIKSQILLCLTKCSIYMEGEMTWKAYSGLSKYSQEIRRDGVVLLITGGDDSPFNAKKLIKYMVSEIISDINTMIEIGDARTTLLMSACQCKQEDVIELLLKHGADPHKKILVENYYIDAFRVACASPDCDVDVARLLIKYGANVNERYESYNNGTCLHQIAKLSKHWEPPCPSIYRMLVEAGANVNLQDDDGYTPAMLSLDHNWFWSPELDMLNYLLSHGARENVRAKNGRTLLDLYKKHDIVDK